MAPLTDQPWYGLILRPLMSKRWRGRPPIIRLRNAIKELLRKHGFRLEKQVAAIDPASVKLIPGWPDLLELVARLESDEPKARPA